MHTHETPSRKCDTNPQLSLLAGLLLSIKWSKIAHHIHPPGNSFALSQSEIIAHGLIKPWACPLEYSLSNEKNTVYLGLKHLWVLAFWSDDSACILPIFSVFHEYFLRIFTPPWFEFEVLSVGSSMARTAGEPLAACFPQCSGPFCPFPPYHAGTE